MKRLLLIPLILLTLGGCAQLKQAVDLTTTTITNPVSAVDIYRIKNVYAASLQFAADWREYCWSKPYVALMASPGSKAICQNRRSTWRIIQRTKAQAHAAISDAQIFVLNYPTLNASQTIAAAWAAVTNFKNAVPAQ